MNRLTYILTGVMLTAVGGCNTQHRIETDSVVEVKPIEIKPIYARLDIYIKIDKELDSFFDFEESVQPEAKPEPVQTPAAPPAPVAPAAPANPAARGGGPGAGAMTTAIAAIPAALKEGEQ